MQVKRTALNMMTDHVLKSTDGFSFGGVLKTGKDEARRMLSFLSSSGCERCLARCFVISRARSMMGWTKVAGYRSCCWI